MDISDKFKQMYRDDAMSRTSVSEWAKRFAEGGMDMEYDVGFRHP
jgi:hypothetical protein